MRLAALLVAAPLLAVAPPAHASQYPLDQVVTIIPKKSTPRLRKAGVKTTADFLVWGKTVEGRKLLASRAGLPVDQITAWVCFADVMRIPGIGPDVARLLAAVGIRTLAELRAAEADATATAILEMNKKSHLSTNPPGAESLRYWIDVARGMPVLIALE